MNSRRSNRPNGKTEGATRAASGLLLLALLAGLPGGCSSTRGLESTDRDPEVDLSLVAGVAVGDYVIVHAGYAIERLDRVEADARLALFAELARAERGDGEPSAGGA